MFESLFVWVSIKNIIFLFRICLNLLSFNFSIARPLTFQTNMVKSFKFDKVLIASTTIKRWNKTVLQVQNKWSITSERNKGFNWIQTIRKPSKAEGDYPHSPNRTHRHITRLNCESSPPPPQTAPEPGFYLLWIYCTYIIFIKDSIMFLNNCFILSLAFLVWCSFCPSLLDLKSCLKFITRARVPFSLRWMLSFLKRSWFLS